MQTRTLTSFFNAIAFGLGCKCSLNAVHQMHFTNFTGIF